MCSNLHGAIDTIELGKHWFPRNSNHNQLLLTELSDELLVPLNQQVPTEVILLL
ncbi:hypothetical protein Hanom_Chr03g00264051 [Helianthus anomalus]